MQVAGGDGVLIQVAKLRSAAALYFFVGMLIAYILVIVIGIGLFVASGFMPSSPAKLTTDPASAVSRSSGS